MAGNIPQSIEIDNKSYKAGEKLKNKVAVITGGDSGIGAATAIAFAKEGAKVCITFFSSKVDAENVTSIITSHGGSCIAIQADVRKPDDCIETVATAMNHYGKLDVVVNNAGTQSPQTSILDISQTQLEETFRTNIFSMFFMVQAALPFLGTDGVILNTASVTAYRGSEELIDYSSTKGAIVSFTRSLAKSLAQLKIRVNAVAPGPVWSPLVLDSFDKDKLETFGRNVPLGRAAQPHEIAPAYVYLASPDAAYITGQVLHVNGGEIVNS